MAGSIASLGVGASRALPVVLSHGSDSFSAVGFNPSGLHTSSDVAGMRDARPESALVRTVELLRVLTVTVSFGMISCIPDSEQCAEGCRYFGQRTPGCSATIFAPGILSTDLHEDGAPAFSPDGSEIYFRAARGDRFSVLFVRREGSDWARPRLAPFSGEHNHGRIAISPDGSRLYFSSDRPADDRSEKRTDFDIWYVEKNAEGWERPVHLGPEVNTTLDELDMSVAADLSLYFNREGSGSDVDDILLSRYVDGRYTEAIPLGAPLNSDRIEAAPFISPDQTFLIFTSEARAGSRGDLDLYVSLREADGSWSEPRNLGDGVNTRFSEKFASLSPDGRFLFFASNRPRSFSYSPEDSFSIFQSQFERTAFFNRPPVRPYFVDMYWVNAEVIQGPEAAACREAREGG